MAEYLIPQQLLNSLMLVAKKAPVPFEQTEPMWMMLMQLQPHKPEADAPTRVAKGPAGPVVPAPPKKPAPRKRAPRPSPAAAKAV